MTTLGREAMIERARGIAASFLDPAVAPGTIEGIKAGRMDGHVWVRIAIKALTASQGDVWLPIETLDVSKLAEGDEMLIHNNRGMFVGAWEPDWSREHGFHGGWWMISDGKDIERALRGGVPTHYRPLPDPPNTRETGEA